MPVFISPGKGAHMQERARSLSRPAGTAQGGTLRRFPFGAGTLAAHTA